MYKKYNIISFVIGAFVFVLLPIPGLTSTTNNLTNSNFDVLFPSCSDLCPQAEKTFQNQHTKLRFYINYTNVDVYTTCVIVQNNCFNLFEDVCKLESEKEPIFFSPPKFFDAAPQVELKLLDLSYTEVRCVETNEEHSNINVLILSHNSISDVTIVEDLRNMTVSYLDLSFNRIKNLIKLSFPGLPDLIWLDLCENNIETISSETFQGLQQLQYLDLSSNLISLQGLHKQCFSGLFHLRSLSLANNLRINALPLFKSLSLDKTKLEVLNLHHLPNLYYIESDTFESLTLLKILNLSFCGLRDFGLGWLNGGPESSLKVLDLTRNQLVAIKLYYFVFFDLNKMKIADISDLDLSASYIISPSPHSRSSKSDFDYKDVLIKWHKDQFYRPLANLSWISLSGNMFLYHLDDDCFAYLPSLQSLYLQNCNISKLKIATKKLRFDKDAISESLPKLEELEAYGNPLQCDCYVRALRNFQASSSSTQRDRTTNRFTRETAPPTFCFDSIKSRGIPIDQVPSSYLICPDEPLSMLFAMLIGPISFAGAIGLVFFCGFFVVTSKRLKHRGSTFYPIPPVQPQKKKSNVVKSKRMRPNFSYSCPVTPQPSPRMTYRTNMVLGKMGTPRTPRLQTRILPSSLLGSFSRLNRSRSPSPSPRVRRKWDSKHNHRIPSVTVSDCSNPKPFSLYKSINKLSPASSKKVAKSLKHLPLSRKGALHNRDSYLNDDEAKPFLNPEESHLMEETQFMGKVRLEKDANGNTVSE